ncbi:MULTISPECIES: hypothetical protein [unclassified Bradyrhizobium]|uniref:hypothetical protein n=1 Tax=unclassified Bradyrhizobium TaxID=2631580 RepID=UPI001FE15362|nr:MULTISPECIES: hypothetical protein [unclassified Bradyrhizobium]
MGIGVVIGTLDWMFHEYRRTWKQKTAKRLQPLSPGQCRVHETGIKMICEYLLKDGRRLGTLRVSSIDTAFADDLFEKLLYKSVDGEKVERRTTVNHAMTTARGAWNTISRAHPHLFAPKNPFEKMGLQSTSRETPHANFEELAAFRATAIELGYPSLATGVLIGWEWLQRKAHIFIRFMAEHYRSESRPNHVYVINYKTSTGSWEPLFDKKGLAALSSANRRARRHESIAADGRPDAATRWKQSALERQGRNADSSRAHFEEDQPRACVPS